MATRGCALVGVVLLLSASLSCASRFLQDTERHPDERQLSGKVMPWNLDGVSSGDGAPGPDVGMAAGSRNAVVGASMGFGEGDGSGPPSGITDHGVGAGEGYGHRQGYGSGPEVGSGYGGGQGYGWGEGSGSGSGPYRCGGPGMGEGFGESGVPCFSDPSWGPGGGRGSGGGGGGGEGDSYMPGGGGYPSGGCCSCDMANFPMPFIGGRPFPGIGFSHDGVKVGGAITRTRHMSMANHEPVPPSASQMTTPGHMNNVAGDEELHM